MKKREEEKRREGKGRSVLSRDTKLEETGYMESISTSTREAVDRLEPRPDLQRDHEEDELR